MKIIIIGAGPGGYETALEAASRGIEVVLVGEGPLGGVCLNEGCIPTKALCAMDAPDLERKRAVISKLQEGISRMLSHRLITFVSGRANLAGGTSVEVEGAVYEGDALIIATGSVSASLPVPGAGLAVDSAAMLELDRAPGRLAVIGGGVIGLEFASIYRKFGSEVTVLEYCPNVLPRFDVDLAKRLKASLAKRGIKVETGACVGGIVRNDDGSLTVSWSRNGKAADTEADCVLMAVGRKPNLLSLNLDDAGIKYGPGGIEVDENMRTNIPGVYAVGDITGGMMLAHAATAQGRRALNHICGLSDNINFGIVPAAVFTVPEAASAGLAEQDCAGMDISVGKANYRANGKAVASGEEDGWCKVIADRSSGRILGAHMLGAHASDIIHEAAALIALGATAGQAKDLIHAHPTLSEVLQAAIHDIQA